MSDRASAGSPIRSRIAARLGPLSERPFRLLWLGQATSAVGDGIVFVALPFAVFGVTSSVSALGLVFLAGVVPRVTLTLVAGVWADRLPRQQVMLASDLVRGMTQALAAALLLTGAARLWQLAVLSAVYGAGTAFFNPAATGLVPATVSAGRLQQANALMGLSRSGASILGPVCGGVLVAAFGAGWAFAVDAATFGASAYSLALLAVGHEPRERQPLTFFEELREGWRELVARTWVWASIVYFSIFNFAIAFTTVLGPTVAQRSLGGASAWGIIAASSGAGSVVGSVVALQFRPARPLLAANLALATVGFEPLLLARPFPVPAIAASAVVGFAAISFAVALWFTALQEHVPREAISRVSAYDWLGSFIFQPLGFVAVGAVAAATSVSIALVVAGIVLTASSLAVASVPSIRRLPSRQAAPAAAPAGSSLGRSVGVAAPTPSCSPSRCLVAWTQPEQPRLSLVCVPQAAAGATPFREWAGHFASDVALYGVRLGGRESRLLDPAPTTIAEVVDELAAAVAALPAAPVALFGHCSGAVLVFALCRRLRAVGGRTPVHLFVAGQPAPRHRDREPRPIASLLRSELVERLRRVGGVEEELLADGEFLELLELVLRADLAVLESFTYEAGDPLPIPITAFAGREDLFVPLDEVAAWREETNRAFDLRVLDGDHLLRAVWLELARAIEQTLNAAAPSAPVSGGRR